MSVKYDSIYLNDTQLYPSIFPAGGGGGGVGATGLFFWGFRSATQVVAQNTNQQLPFTLLNASPEFTVAGGNQLNYTGATKNFAIYFQGTCQYSGMSMLDTYAWIQIRKNGTPLPVGSNCVYVENINAPLRSLECQAYISLTPFDYITFFATGENGGFQFIDRSISVGGISYSTDPYTILVQQI